MMIPASYLFKDIYKQHWEEADAPAVVEQRSRRHDGLLTPITNAIAALFHRRERHEPSFITGQAKTSW